MSLETAPMRVGVLTSWRVPCGIYQYSSRMVEALARIPGVEPVVLAGRADEHRSVPGEWDGEVHNAAKIGLWRDDGVYELDQQLILDLGLGALHVQYQSMLFNQDSLGALVRAFPGPTAITYHDNCTLPTFPHEDFDLHFSHRWNIGPPNVEALEFPIEARVPIVRTFGLGRSRADFIGEICERRGWIFESANSHEPIHGGDYSHWHTHEQLIHWLRGADVIVLWYDDNGAAGSSQAVRTAMASRRPVFSNDTTWFSDLPKLLHDSAGPLYQQVGSLDELERELADLFVRPYIRAHSWDRTAEHLLQRYSSVPVQA